MSLSECDVSVCGSCCVVETIVGGGIGGTGNTPDAKNLGRFSIDISTIALLAFDPRDGALHFAGAGTSGHVSRVDPTTGLVSVVGKVVSPVAGAFDDLGVLHVATATQIFVFNSRDGSTSVLAGGGGGDQDATGSAAGFTNIRSLVFDGSGRLVVVDGNRLRHCTKHGVVTTFCGDNAAGHVDGLATAARFSSPYAVAFDRTDGSLLVADTDNYRIRKISPTYQVSTIAGDGQARHQDGRATAASFHSPVALVAVAGWTYVLDSGSHTVRCVASDGHVTTIAGSPNNPGFVDQSGADARLMLTFGSRLASDGRGSFVFSSCTHMLHQNLNQRHAPAPHVAHRLRQFRAEQQSLSRAAPSTLLADLILLLDDAACSDLRVVAADGRAVHTSRSLLRLRSSFFRTMLDSACKEGGEETTVITLPHGFDALRAIIRFVHTDELEVDAEYCCEVLVLSAMWELPRLTVLAEYEIARALSPSNVCAILATAELHSAADLRAICIAYIVRNFAAVRIHSDLRTLDKAQLLELMMALPEFGF